MTLVRCIISCHFVCDKKFRVVLCPLLVPDSGDPAAHPVHLLLSGKVDWETFDTECVSSAWGDDYIGEASRTISGIPCQDWAEQWPHAHSYDDVRYFADYVSDPQVELSDVVNHCRNPAMSEYVDAQPWCYTASEDVVKEFCDIPRCKRKKQQRRST